jgi:hypothetical protein
VTIRWRGCDAPRRLAIITPFPPILRSLSTRRVRYLKVLGLLVLAIIAFRLLRLVTTPLFRALGFYRYYSPLLFTVPTPTATELHLGTSYDFFLHAISPRLTLAQLAEGLVGLCAATERGEIPRGEVIEGTVCFLSEPTLRRFGFQPRALGPLRFLLVLANYPELLLLTSIAKGAFAPVDLTRVRRVRTTAEKLLEQKRHLETFRTLLSRDALGVPLDLAGSPPPS